jgi:hypothetical protein
MRDASEGSVRPFQGRSTLGRSRPGEAHAEDGYYALRLCCSACTRFLYGDVRRYRHPAPTCESFRTAIPRLDRTRGRGQDTRIKGHSYPQAWYEGAVAGLLSQISRIDDGAVTEVVRLHQLHQPREDELVLARIPSGQGGGGADVRANEACRGVAGHDGQLHGSGRRERRAHDPGGQRWKPDEAAARRPTRLHRGGFNQGCGKELGHH